ncbi:Predicted PurR-regulated permease PerM [Daejeonella rubra]|uniref:Predicted PurR-regulated permease PerM n=1 Tax=Daejeonella rubra TaxID=990371 RepID=A0A1G9UE06_9SPHI|nr:AI-2E family transporter [Daejeonella rubra]SDM57954.1 Predicted PurR-regulated permease PerM [Daejeonella rubra]
MKELPLTVRRSIELIGICLLGALLSIGNDIIMPVLMAFFLSIVLLPLYRFLRAWKFPEFLSILLPILLGAVFIAGVIWFFSAQISILAADFPQIQKNVNYHLNNISDWINNKTDFSTKEQIKFLNDQSNKLLTNAGNIIGGAAGSITSAFIFIGLVPIYIYLFLSYKNLLLRFVFVWFEPDQHKKVKEVMKETEIIIKSYLIGLLIQIAYITVLLGGILLLLDIKHALLIGVIFALLNLIPYVGALIGNLLGVMLTLTSSQELLPIFTVLGVIAIVQFLDNNILMPRIVGSKVKINAFAAILGVFIAGSLAGISGMFLALPLVAVLKIIFDRSNIFKPWGILLGDENPVKSPMRFPKLRMSSKKVDKELKIENDITPLEKRQNNK